MPVPSSTSPSPAPSATSDGVFRIGTLFPATGTASYLGPAQADGVNLAAADINAAGGVLGKPVEVLQRDSGDVTTATLETSFADLQAKGADVVIGPSSSVLVERLMPKSAAAKIPLITPAATSSRLTALGATGYLFRTVPSAALQGTVLGTLIAPGTKPKVSLIYFDDDNGKAIRASLTASLEKAGGSLASAQTFAVGTDLNAVVAATVAAAPVAVVMVSPFSVNDQNKALITALGAAGLGGAKLWLTSDDMADYSQVLPVNSLANVNGLLEGVNASDAFKARLKAADAGIANYLYAAEAYDATVVAALSAAVGKRVSGASVAKHLRAVTSGGIKCTSYAECLQVLKTRTDIDYDGLTGDIAFDANGDPHPGHYGTYRYDGENRFARVGDAIGG